MIRNEPSPAPPYDNHGPWRERLAFYVDTAREMSEQTEPQAMVQAYGRRMRELASIDASVSLSRRGYSRPAVRVTRASIWGQDINPWRLDSKVIVHPGGFFSDLIWKDEVTIIDDYVVPDDDPAAPFCAGMRSFVAIPLFDGGEAINMVVVMRREPRGFPHDLVPERVMMSNLFGRATHNLILREQVREAYEKVDRELQIVADIQRSLLPSELPRIPGVELAAHYRTSTHAGGDYYDFFPLPDGRVGILIADVSGHGTPAAVIMAVTHSIAHTHDGPPAPPSLLMNFVNRHLAARYTNGNGTFVTAFYGIYDPARRELLHASAGHCPPRVRRGRDGSVESRFCEAGLPLGIEADETYTDGVLHFDRGDLLVLYTDGVTEARRPSDNELFGVERLDAILQSSPAEAGASVSRVLAALDEFTSSRPPNDDQTLLAASFT